MCETGVEVPIMTEVTVRAIYFPEKESLFTLRDHLQETLPMKERLVFPMVDDGLLKKK